MKQIFLDHEFILEFESLTNKVRLIASKGDEELACRIESIKKLNEFLVNEERSLFKGRLQLEKTKNEIAIILGGNRIGIVSVHLFRAALSN